MLLIMGFITHTISSQTSTGVYNMNYLKNKVAELNKVPVSSVKSVEVLTFGNESYVYAKLVSGTTPITYAHAIGTGGGIEPPFIKGSITCTGVNCSECDIAGWPDITKVYCSCERKVNGDGYCNMTKSIGL